MSLWKKISLGVLIFIVLLLGTVAFLVGTTTGLHLLFNAANRWVPGLEIGQVTGGWRDLRLKNIRYEQPGVAVNAGEFHLADFQPGNPAVRRLQHQMQAAGRADEECDRPQQQDQKDQYPEAYLLP